MRGACSDPQLVNLWLNRYSDLHSVRVICNNDCEVEKVDSVKSLGVYIDKHLNWSTHIEKISKKIASAIGALKRIGPYVTTDAAIHVYRALIQPHFDYCCSVWDGLGQILSSKIQKLQNRAARIVKQTSYKCQCGCAL